MGLSVNLNKIQLNLLQLFTGDNLKLIFQKYNMLGLFHFLQTEVQPKLSRKTNQKRKVFVYVGHWPRQSWGPRRRRSRTLCRRGLCAALPTAKPKRKKKKKKKWIYELKVFDEITQRKTYHFIAYRASFLACFVSLVRISEAFETSSFTNLADFYILG